MQTSEVIRFCQEGPTQTRSVGIWRLSSTNDSGHLTRWRRPAASATWCFASGSNAAFPRQRPPLAGAAGRPPVPRLGSGYGPARPSDVLFIRSCPILQGNRGGGQGPKGSRPRRCICPQRLCGPSSAHVQCVALGPDLLQISALHSGPKCQSGSFVGFTSFQNIVSVTSVHRKQENLHQKIRKWMVNSLGESVFMPVSAFPLRFHDPASPCTQKTRLLTREDLYFSL